MTLKKTLLLACSALTALCLLSACVQSEAAAPSSTEPESVSASLPDSSTSNSSSSSRPDSTETPKSSSAESRSASQSAATPSSSQSTPSAAPPPSSTQAPVSSAPPAAQPQAPAPAPEPCTEPAPQPAPAPVPAPEPPPAPAVDAGACIAEARAYALGKGMTEDGSLHTGNSGYLNPPDISTLSQASVIADLKYCIDVYAGYSPDDPSLVHFNIVQSGNLIYVLYQ